MLLDDGALRTDINSPPHFIAFENANKPLKIYEALASFTLAGPQEQPLDVFSLSFSAWPWVLY